MLVPEISVVVPVKDEAGNVVPLLNEIAAALAGEAAEFIFVDDASRDDTAGILLKEKARIPQLRVLKHEKNGGQSAAIRSGVLAARGRLIVTLDGDGQNIPADIQKLLARYRDPARPLRVRMVAGQRVGRKDTAAKRLASRLANAIRSRLLNDDTRDTGCGLKLFERETFLRLPYFDNIHRFLPALFRREGAGIAFADVGHRPRGSGRSKYGVFDRALISIRDLMGVMWLMARRRNTGETREL
ncbi:MAG: glycosyltransferase family 2 protein [Alphaproteobacteria bacterium]|nr:glycosyltransferase family 2 protein [Alphaproteobacteria bacterium]